MKPLEMHVRHTCTSRIGSTEPLGVWRELALEEQHIVTYLNTKKRDSQGSRKNQGQRKVHIPLVSKIKEAIILLSLYGFFVVIVFEVCCPYGLVLACA